MNDELTPEEIEQIQRRRRIRAAIVVVVVIAMIATLLFPVIIRIISDPRPPDVIVAGHARVDWRSMSP